GTAEPPPRAGGGGGAGSAASAMAGDGALGCSGWLRASQPMNPTTERSAAPEARRLLSKVGPPATGPGSRIVARGGGLHNPAGPRCADRSHASSVRPPPAL